MKNEKTKEFKKRLYVLILQTIKLVESAKKSSTSRIIGDQLIRSITSILANYIEGHAASSKKDYTNYFNYSLKSANESKVWIALLKDTDNVDRDKTAFLLKELDEISRIFGSSLLTLKGKNKNI
ncbi:MAG: four helix bundle protein [Candidatus Levybacteria bacterium]|nr:four helix bundle protein [Candidatus Levybacteria bacterium]